MDSHKPDTSTAKLGTIGRYQILEALESGGMGTVYRAFDPRLQTQVCIKQIKEGPGSADFHKRWLPEVRAIAQLRHHPNIVNIYDASEAEFDGRPTIVMEFIEGRTLHRIIKNRDRIALSTRLHYMEQLAAGLGFAHSKRIVHRDIKPANLMVDASGVLKILDFGIARMSGGATASAIVGTMNYMSPEQWGRDPVDARSDIFSVGAVFYEMLSGRRAFAGETVVEVYPLILNADPTPLEELCPGLDPDIVRIVRRLLEKRPADRYQTLEPVQREIERIRTRLTPAAEEHFTQTLRWEQLPIDAVATPTPGRPVIDRESVARRRAAKIDTAVHAAQQAFANSSYDDVLVACGQVLEFDPDHRVALDLLDRARAALHQGDALRLAAEAREQFARGEFTRAQQSVEAALALSPGDLGMTAFRAQIAYAKAELDRARANLKAIQDAMALVHETIDTGSLEQARHHIAVVLDLDPTHVEALRLRTLVHRLVDERDRRGEAKAAPLLSHADTRPLQRLDQFRGPEHQQQAAEQTTPTASTADEGVNRAAAVHAPLLRFWRPIAGALAAVAVLIVSVQFLRTRSSVEPEPTAPAATSPSPVSTAPEPPPPASPADDAGAKRPEPSAPSSAAGRGVGVAGSEQVPASRPLATEPRPEPGNRPKPPDGRGSSTVRDGAANSAAVSARLEANRYLRQAQENLDVGDLDAAASNTAKARALDPANPGLPKMQQDIETLKRLELGRRKGAPGP